jgi:glycosyltransferase involved in cell wall biosynthesis
MRIGVMLRAFDEKGGVGVYARNVVRELLDLDRRNHYVLFYRDPANLGSHAARPNVEERVVRGANNLVWDQIRIPIACWRSRLDLVFHPKFTVPLFAPCRAAMVVHGADWFIPDQARFYGWWDVRYIRTAMPLYFRRAGVILSVSAMTTENFRKVLRVPPGKIRTVYFGPARHFRRIEDGATIEATRARYALPERFILTLCKPLGDRRKNLDQLLRAYERYHGSAERPLPLVVGGRDCDRFRSEYRIPEAGYGRDILFPGWIEQEDLPAIYSLAELFVYPSRLEAFPIPLTEAMACGTPIVTSDANGLREIAGEAAVLVDPEDPDAIASAMADVLADGQLRVSLSERGLARVKRFSWERCARETLAILEELGARGAGPASA